MITGITTIVSSACNLQCSFCYLHKHDALINFDKDIVKGWESQIYPDIVNQVLIKLNEKPENIVDWSLWGGESLLHIDKLIPNLSKMLFYFPNINRLILSTNWTINIKEFFNFLTELDKLLTHELNVHLQLSIDGPPGIISENGHNGWDKYLDNFKLFTNLVNNYQFHHVVIKIGINATIGKDLYFQTFNTINGIKDYMTYMQTFLNQLKELCISRSLILWNTCIFPGCANPYAATVEEGLELSKIAQLWDYVKTSYFPNLNPMSFNEFGCGINGIFGEKNYYTSNSECGELKTNYTILPNGTIVNCPSSYIEHLKEYQEECLKMGDNKRYQSAIIHSSLSFNPLTASDEDIKKFNWYVHNGIRNTESTYMHYMLETTKELLKSSQISKIYLNNDQLLVDHLLDLSHVGYCTHENINDTLNPFLTSVSFYRRYLNGFINYLHIRYEQYLKERL